jgi:HD-like signal output (HDOD) protein
MKRRVLFVDDESSLLDGLRRALRPQRHAWDMAFAESAEEALRLADARPFDAVVSDMRMPGMDGTELLAAFKRRHPETVRIVLSGQSDERAVLRCVGNIHQYLSKPCDTDVLKGTLLRALALRDTLAEPRLRKLVTGLDTLPSMPAVYAELTRRLKDPEFSVNEAGDLIARDPAMTAKVLQLVNSAFFGLGHRVVDPRQAVVRIGLETLQALVLSAGVFVQFEGFDALVRGLSLEGLWRHSVAVADLAGRIARAQGGGPVLAEEAMLAGLLHELGTLILAHNLPRQYTEVVLAWRRERRPRHAIERRHLGADHGRVGAYLLGLWGLPNPVVEAVAFHHEPAACPHEQFSPLTAVHVADALLECSLAGAAPAGGDGRHVDRDYLTRLGLDGRLADWEALASTR